MRKYLFPLIKNFGFPNINGDVDRSKTVCKMIVKYTSQTTDMTMGGGDRGGPTGTASCQEVLIDEQLTGKHILSPMSPREPNQHLSKWMRKLNPSNMKLHWV